MNKDKAIDALIACAENEVGYLEKKSNSQLDDKTANAGYNNYTKYWRDVYPQYQAQAWCAAFVSWCMMKTFGLETTKNSLNIGLMYTVLLLEISLQSMQIHSEETL